MLIENCFSHWELFLTVEESFRQQEVLPDRAEKLQSLKITTYLVRTAIANSEFNLSGQNSFCQQDVIPIRLEQLQSTGSPTCQVRTAPVQSTGNPTCQVKQLLSPWGPTRSRRTHVVIKKSCLPRLGQLFTKDLICQVKKHNCSQLSALLGNHISQASRAVIVCDVMYSGERTVDQCKWFLTPYDLFS